MSARPVVVHVSPHPDDESIGAPCTLFGLREAGWRVVNIAVSLGRTEQRPRRRREVEEACRRAGFELIVLDPPADISRDGSADAHGHLVETLESTFAQLLPSIVVSPSSDDIHHGHEVVSTAVLGAVRRHSHPINVWQWGLWADLAAPNIFVPVSAEHLDRAKYAMAAHAGEVTRNNYVDLIEARARVAAIRGAERVFGWGHNAQPERHAELLHEIVWDGATEHLPRCGRRLDLSQPLGRGQ